MSVSLALELELTLIRLHTLTWQGGDKRKRRRQEGLGGGQLFKGGDYFKYIHLKGAIIQGRRLIEGRLLFEEVW